jgi:excisionase family DNA binding protein
MTYQPKLMTMKQASEYFAKRGVPSSITTIQKLINKKKIDYVRLGRKNYFYQSYLEQYIESNLTFHLDQKDLFV